MKYTANNIILIANQSLDCTDCAIFHINISIHLCHTWAMGIIHRYAGCTIPFVSSMYNTQQMCAFDVSLGTFTFCLIHVTYTRRLRHIRFFLSYLPILFQWLKWFWCVHQHSIRLVCLFVLACRIDISRFAVRFFFKLEWLIQANSVRVRLIAWMNDQNSFDFFYEHDWFLTFELKL